MIDDDREVPFYLRKDPPPEVRNPRVYAPDGSFTICSCGTGGRWMWRTADDKPGVYHCEACHQRRALPPVDVL